MDQLRRDICEVVNELCPEDSVGLLLSGGADSTVVGMAAQALGKEVHSFSFKMDGIDSWDFDQAQRTSDLLGWTFHPVVVPFNNPKTDFLDLIQKHGCRKKAELEVLLPFIYLAKAVVESGFEHVLSGFTAPLPTNTNDQKKTRLDLEGYWNNIKQRQFSIDGIEFDSSATQRCFEYAQQIGLELLQPLADDRIKARFYGKTWSEIHSPYWKAPWKLAFEEEFKKVGLLDQVKTPPMQVGGSVQSYFENLLSDPEINFKGYTKGDERSRLSQLVRLWSKPNAPKNLVTCSVSRQFETYLIKDVKDASSKNHFTVISTFAGGGGSSTGYRLAGGNVVLMNEFIPEAVRTYRANYPETFVSDVDIRKITRRGGRKYVLDWLETFGLREGELDILDGSPPCVTFSNARKGDDKTLAKNVKYSDTTQDRIGMLIHDFVYMANCIKPKVCVIENVPEIARAELYHIAMNRIRKWGYRVNGQILSSSSFGVAQNRRRLITIAVRPDVCKSAGIRSENDLLRIFPQGSIYEPTVRDALADVKNDPEEVEYLLSATVRSARYELVKALPKSPKLPIRLNHLEPSWTSDFNLTRASWDKPCPTLTQMGQQAGAGGIYHPDEDRVFTIAELKRLTGLPDDFRLTGSFNKKAERCCRMVTPPLYKHLAQSIYEQVLKSASG